MGKKKLLTLGILIVVLAGVFVPHVAFGQTAGDILKTAAAGAAGPVGLLFAPSDLSPATAIFSVFAVSISQFLMGLSSLVLVFSA